MKKQLLAVACVLGLAACAGSDLVTEASVTPDSPRFAATSEEVSIHGMTIGPKGAIWVSNGDQTLCGTYQWSIWTYSGWNYILTKEFCGTSAWSSFEGEAWVGGDVSVAAHGDNGNTSLGGIAADLTKDIRVFGVPQGGYLIFNAGARTGCEFSYWRGGDLPQYYRVNPLIHHAGDGSADYEAVFYCSGR